MYSGVMSWGANTTSDGWRKGPWTAPEDKLLVEYVKVYGEGRWNNVSRFAGLRRNGKSCRLRWVNYLRPDLKKGQITPHEEKIIVELHAKLGNRWSQIAKSLEGRTDNEIKNYWRTHFKKKTKSDPEKEKERLQRRQQFQLQQYQLLCRQFEQGQANDMVNFAPWVNESHNRAANDSNCLAGEAVLPNAIDEQGFAYPYPYPIIDNYTTVANASNEDIVWDDGLWGFDDLMHNFGTSNY